MVANITSLMDFGFIIGALLRSNLDFQLCASNASVFTVTLKGTGNPGTDLACEYHTPTYEGQPLSFPITLRCTTKLSPVGFFCRGNVSGPASHTDPQRVGCPRDDVQRSLSLI